MSNEARTCEFINELVANGIIDAIGEAVSIQDINFKILYQNQRHMDMVGDHLGKYCYDVYQCKRSACDECHMTMCIKDGWVHKRDRVRTTDRGVFHYEITGSPIRDSDGKIIAGIEVVRDITRRKLIEDSLKKSRDEMEMQINERTQDFKKINEKLLREISKRQKIYEVLHDSEARFRAVAETSADLIWEGDVREDSLVWFGDVDRFLGYEKGEFPRTVKGHLDSVHPEDRDTMLELINSAIETGKDFYAVYRMKCKNGSYRYWDERGKAVGFEDGKAVKWIGSVTDITDKKKAEEQVIERTSELARINEKLSLEISERRKIEKELREKEERFRAISESAREWIWEVDSDGKYTYSSPMVEKILGYSRDEILGKHFYDLFHPDDGMDLKREAIEVFKRKRAFRDFINRNVHKNGYTVWLSTSGIPIIDTEGNLIGYRGADTDITEKKKAEEQLHTSKEMYKKLSQEFNTLLNAIPDNLILLSPDLKIVWLNKAAASGFGRHASELTSKYCYKLCCSIFTPCENCPALKSFQSGKEEDVQITTAEGRVWDIRAFPVKDRSRVKNVIEVARDITGRIRMEQEAKMMQTKLIHANKMTSLGTLVSGVVHEINNPNSYILSNAQLFSDIWKDVVKILSKQYRGKKDFQLGGLWFSQIRKSTPEMLDGIIEGSERINKIINTLKNFARPDATGMDGKVDIRRAIKYSKSILSSQIKKSTKKFRVDIEKKLPPVKGNSQQIEQVILNLIMNSLQALPDKNCGIWISVAVSKKAGFVLIAVRDEGVGMSRDVIDRATEPFFTTKLGSGGTGLGLSISYSIIKEHGGSLEFESEPGKGTTVSIELPVYKT